MEEMQEQLISRQDIRPIEITTRPFFEPPTPQTQKEAEKLPPGKIKRHGSVSCQVHA